MSKRKAFCDLSSRQKRRRRKQQLEADIGGQNVHPCMDEPTLSDPLPKCPGKSQEHIFIIYLLR